MANHFITYSELPTSVAPIIGSVIGKAMYRLFFCISVSDQRHDEKSNRYGYCVCI